MDWDLPQLQALAAVIDHGSLDAAATALQVTPSAISQRLKVLERSVGAVLVQRTRPARPTDAGRTVVRLARQLQMAAEETEQALRASQRRPQVRLAVNADSLATWVLPALSEVSNQVRLTFLREDQDHTAELLREGSVMAAVTSEHRPVQGCTVQPLGVMRYRPTSSEEFAARWFTDGVTARTLAVAPVVVFDERDQLQDTQLRDAGVNPTDPPRHAVPASTQYAEAVGLGWGWGMVPDVQQLDWSGVDLAALPRSRLATHDVQLYWQQWSLDTPSLGAVAAAVRAGARRWLG